MLTHPWDPGTQCHVCSSGRPAGALAEYAFCTHASLDDAKAAAEASLTHGRTAQVRISVGKAYEVMHDERRWAAEGLAKELRQTGLDVELEIIEYVPGRRGLGPMEWTAIFIGTNVAIALINALTQDLYQRAKDMLRSRRKAKGGKGVHLGFKIYGPKNEVLREWTTKEDDDKPKEDA